MNINHANIYIVDGLNGVVDIVDTFKSVIWNNQYYGKGDFELVVAGIPANVKRLTVGRYLVRDENITSGEYHDVMIIESRELSFDVEDGWMLTVRGSGLKNILARRIIWNQTTSLGKVEKIIRSVINDNVINAADTRRRIPNFILDAEKGFSEDLKQEDTDSQLSGENIADWLVTICTNYSIGWDIFIKDGKYVFTLYKGTDRTYNQTAVVPVVFSPKYDNLVTSTYTYNMENYKNAAIVAGEGEGSNQRIVSVGDASGLDRYETFIDGSSVSSNTIITLETYMKMLTDYGNEQLTATQELEKFEGEVLNNGMYTINQDYFLGDLVQIENENNISAATRIIEVIYSEDENGWIITPTFSAWEDN